MPQHLGSNFWTLPCCWSGHARGGGKEAISGKTCRCLSDDWEVVATKQGLVRKSSFLFLGLKQHQKPGRVSWNVGFGYLVGVFSDVFFRNFAFYNLYLFFTSLEGRPWHTPQAYLWDCFQIKPVVSNPWIHELFTILFFWLRKITGKSKKMTPGEKKSRHVLHPKKSHLCYFQPPSLLDPLWDLL